MKVRIDNEGREKCPDRKVAQVNQSRHEQRPRAACSRPGTRIHIHRIKVTVRASPAKLSEPGATVFFPHVFVCRSVSRKTFRCCDCVLQCFACLPLRVPLLPTLGSRDRSPFTECLKKRLSNLMTWIVREKYHPYKIFLPRSHSRLELMNHNRTFF